MHPGDPDTHLPEPPPGSAGELVPNLQEDLRRIADQVPPHEYGYATAREFAVGKYSRYRQRRRYALT